MRINYNMTLLAKPIADVVVNRTLLTACHRRRTPCLFTPQTASKRVKHAICRDAVRSGTTPQGGETVGHSGFKMYKSTTRCRTTAVAREVRVQEAQLALRAVEPLRITIGNANLFAEPLNARMKVEIKVLAPPRSAGSAGAVTTTQHVL